MNLLNRVKSRIFQEVFIETEATEAYNIWSQSYDDQPYNLMLRLDEELFSCLLQKVQIANKKIIDFGCGTGRHWKRILANKPMELTGLDISEGMLKKLKEKFPAAVTQKISDNYLNSFEGNSIDLIISTLTIAHIDNIKELFYSWSRILKYGGDLLITDFHPVLLKKGGKRSFNYSGKKISIKNYVHNLSELKLIAARANLLAIHMEEKLINKETKQFYERQNALKLYNRYKGQPVIYGIHFRKQ